MADVLARWYERAAANPQRIVLADAGDARAAEAADRLRADGLAEPIVMGASSTAAIRPHKPEARSTGLEGACPSSAISLATL